LSTDPTQIMQQPTTPTPVFVDVNNLISQVADAVRPQLVQAATDAAARLHAESLTAIGNVAKDVEANRTQIEAAAASIGQSYVHRLTSPRIQAILILGTAGVVWAGCLATWIAYLLGAPDAQGIVGWAGAAFAGSSAGLTILHQFGLLGATGTPKEATVLMQGVSAPSVVTATTTTP